MDDLAPCTVSTEAIATRSEQRGRAEWFGLIFGSIASRGTTWSAECANVARMAATGLSASAEPPDETGAGGWYTASLINNKSTGHIN